MATVFAQLHIEGENKGVHAFLVPLRDPKGNINPGIRIADVGHKMGINGVNNGRIWFDHVRIPRVNMLNKVANVTPEGKYDSWIPDNDIRFTAFIGMIFIPF
jgi:acyl-CoA oxidase